MSEARVLFEQELEELSRDFERIRHEGGKRPRYGEELRARAASLVERGVPALRVAKRCGVAPAQVYLWRSEVSRERGTQVRVVPVVPDHKEPRFRLLWGPLRIEVL